MISTRWVYHEKQRDKKRENRREEGEEEKRASRRTPLIDQNAKKKIRS